MSKAMFPFACFLAVMLCSVARPEVGEDPPPPKPPTFQVPRDWKAVEAGPIASARFQIGDGDRAASMAVTGMPGDGGGLAANVNRWRSRLGLEPVSESEALRSLQPIKVDGVPGHSLDLTGPDVAGKPRLRIVVAVVRRGDRTWYFNLTGPASLVREQKAAFDGLLKSVRFEK